MSIDLIRFALAALATFRLADLVAIDDGPFDVFDRLRLRMGAYDLNESGKPATSLGKLIACPHCLGIYIAALLLVWSLGFLPAWTDLIVYWLALAGLQSAIEVVGGRA